MRIKVLFFAVLFVIFLCASPIPASAETREVVYNIPFFTAGWIGGEPGSPGSQEWVTKYTVSNRSDNGVSLIVKYFDSTGKYTPVNYACSGPFLLERGNGVGHHGTLGPKQSGLITVQGFSDYDGSTKVPDKNGYFKIYSTETKSLTGEWLPDLEFTVSYLLRDERGAPVSTLGLSQFTKEGQMSLRLYSSENGDGGSSIAILNPNSNPVAIAVKAWDQRGNVIGNQTVTLQKETNISLFISEIFKNDPLWAKASLSLMDVVAVEFVASLPIQVVGLRADFPPGKFLISGIPFFSTSPTSK